MKPVLRLGSLIAAVLLTIAALHAEQAANNDAGSLSGYVQSLWPAARSAGVGATTFHKALDGVTADPEVLALTRKQPEYNLSMGEYIARSLARSRIEKGRILLNVWSAVLDRIEDRFGVDRFIIMALWGVETGYGASSGHKDAVRSIATLAYAKYRGDDFWQNELIQALLILQSGNIDRSLLLGSWAGAMGQPQFLPSSYLKYAVDFDGDGRRDIWKSVPDTLASIANYLKLNGWTSGTPWGLAINLPDGYDLRVSRGTLVEWKQRGVTGYAGRELSSSGNAILFHPAGYPGPAFLVTGNFDVIKTYNNSDPYALGVALLADELRGASALNIAWPNQRPLSRNERIELQHGIARLGYPVNNFLGWLDFDIRDAVRKIQFENGMTPDGEPSKELLAIVRRRASLDR